MKNIISKILFVIILTVFSSCASVRWFAIEVQEPASITLPVSVQNVLLLNNTVPQSSQLGEIQNRDGQPIEQKFSLSLDSTVWIAIRSLSASLNQSQFFNDIYVYSDLIRTDKEWLAINPLSKEIQDEFYSTEKYDALISIDRLLYMINENTKVIKGNQTYNPLIPVNITANAILTSSLYLRGKETPFKIFSLFDSLSVNTMVYNDSITIYREIPMNLVENLAFILGEKMASSLAPSWKTVERLTFTNQSARMKEAHSLSLADKWAEAERIWQAEYEKKSKPIDKAKLALNLAVANEMQDKFDVAISWAGKASRHLAASDPSQHTEETAFITQYVIELQQRIQYNRLLDMQWGKEEESH
jgi:hypothetical protein